MTSASCGTAAWLSELRPAFGEAEFFFEPVLLKLRDGASHLWAHRVIRTPQIYEVAEME